MFNEFKLMYYRYFYRIVTMLTFSCGAAVVNVLSMVYLLFSLYFLRAGENVIIKENLRKRAWGVYRAYNFMWFFAIIVYQIPATLIDIPLETQGT